MKVMGMKNKSRQIDALTTCGKFGLLLTKAIA